jgi:alpha-N-arabinofuranosidase
MTNSGNRQSLTKFMETKKMTGLVLTMLCVFVGSLTAQSSRAANAEARIKIDIDRKIGRINKNLYGNFVEHLGRCVYGGVYDPDSEQADEKGFRKDVLEAVKGLSVSWLDGVGPQRTPRMELAWARLETNKFGTNEFMEFAKEIGTEPYFAVNMGTGTIEEAQRWVEYCNVKEGPYFAELRRKHGYPEPHNIKYWSLGNEMDGFWQMGHLNAEDYSKKAREAAKLMRLTSPGIKLVAAGSSNYRPNADPDEWNSTILHELRDVVDYIALHIYVGNPDNNYYNFLSTPLVCEERTQVAFSPSAPDEQRTTRVPARRVAKRNSTRGRK